MTRCAALRSGAIVADEEREPAPQPDDDAKRSKPLTFAVMRWLPTESDDLGDSQHERRPLPCSVSLVDAPPAESEPEQHQRRMRRHGRSALRLGRRIDALAAVLDDPEPAFRCLVRFLAGLPRGAINRMTGFTRTASTWHHAEADVRASRGLATYTLEPLID